MMDMWRKAIASLLAATLIVAALWTAGSASPGGAAAAEKLPFSDIEKHWAKEYILKAAASGLVEGFPDGTFQPDAVVTADQFAAMMLRAFSDGKGAFAEDFMNELTYLQPGFKATIRSAVRQSGFKFEKAKTGYWAKTYIDMLYDMEYLLDIDSEYPKNYELYKKPLKRENASYFLGNWIRIFEENYDLLYTNYVFENSGYKDFNSFTNSPIGAYRANVLMAGLMTGYPNNYFYPHRYVTRAEALTMIQRLRNKDMRVPFQVDLTGKYYMEMNGRITMFSDKTQYDYYNKIVELAKETVKTGYLEVDTGGVWIWDSKDDADKNDFLAKIGDYENVPSYEFSIAVSNSNSRIVGIQYPIKQKAKHSQSFQETLFEYLVGSGYGKELKSKLLEAEKSERKINFTINKKKFEFFTDGKFNVLEMTY
jgi:hypothetical protein